jgi:hypothetical protein
MKQLLLVLALAGSIALPAQAQSISAKQTEVMKQLIATYAKQAKSEKIKAKGKSNSADEFSVSVGREFYLERRVWGAQDEVTIDYQVPTCSNCHSADPMKEGTHVKTKKPIKPLAPAASPERFTSAAKVEKNFTEHCQDIYKRDCSAVEKGHFLTYLMSVK